MPRHIVFTAWQEPAYDAKVIAWIYWKTEICPTTGRKHWQGCAHSTKQHRITGWKTVLGAGDTVHIEAQRGTTEQTRQYCAKGDGDEHEFGTPNTQGSQSLSIQTRHGILDGSICVRDVIQDVESGHTLSFLERLQNYATIPIIEKKVIWLWGPTESGKTRKAIELAGADFWLSESMGQINRWNKYIGQKVIILDELRPEQLPWSYLLRLLDRYPMHLNVKYGTMPLRAHTIIITTNMSPTDFWRSDREGLAEDPRQLTRRISSVVEMESVPRTEVEGNTSPQLCRLRKNTQNTTHC